MADWQKVTLLVVGFNVGNVIYQLLSGGMDWSLALDRSFFSTSGVLLTAWALLGSSNKTNHSKG